MSYWRYFTSQFLKALPALAVGAFAALLLAQCHYGSLS